MTTPLTALDLFCGGGGTGMGYKLAGYTVTGADLHDHSRTYSRVGDFYQLDWREALERFGERADLIHASPPCQGYSRHMRHLASPGKPMLIEEVREALKATGKAWVIENVPGAPLVAFDSLFGDFGAELCGTQFGLRIRRHRLFEASHPVTPPRACDHSKPAMNPHYSKSREAIYAEYGRTDPEKPWREEMGVPWLNRQQGRESVPPKFTEHLGNQVKAQIIAAEAA